MSFLGAISTALPLTMIAALVGLRIGRRIGGRMNDVERTQLYGMQASLLGLLALLLGFSFAMAESRFDLRKQLVVDETNAIGTARLRAGVVGGEGGRAVQALLDQYVATRLRGYAARDDGGLQAAIAESQRQQRDIWSHVTALERAAPTSLPAALLMQSVNEVIDLHGKRIAAGHNHVPRLVLIMLLVVAAVTMGWVGTGVGVASPRGIGATLVLSLLVSLVVAVIVDLDQPRSGLIRVTQAMLVDLQRSVE